MRMTAIGCLLGVLVVAGCSGTVLKDGSGATPGEDLTSVGSDNHS